MYGSGTYFFRKRADFPIVQAVLFVIKLAGSTSGVLFVAGSPPIAAAVKLTIDFHFFRHA